MRYKLSCLEVVAVSDFDPDQISLGTDPLPDATERYWRARELPEVGSQWVAPKYLWGMDVGDVPFTILSADSSGIRVKPLKPIDPERLKALNPISLERWKQYVRDGVVHHIDDWPAFAGWRDSQLTPTERAEDPKIASAWDYDPDKDPALREMIRRRLRELKPGMRVRSTYTREYGTIASIEGEEIFIDWDDGDYSPVSVGAITPIDQGMQLRLAADPKQDFICTPLFGPNYGRYLLVSPHLGYSVFAISAPAMLGYVAEGIRPMSWDDIPPEIQDKIANQPKAPEVESEPGAKAQQHLF